MDVVVHPEAPRSSPIVPPAVWIVGPRSVSGHPWAAGRSAPIRALRGVRATRPILRAMRRLVAIVVLTTLVAACAGSEGAGPDRTVRILAGEAATLDPAAQSDAGSAAITAQLFESLTAFDAQLQLRP